MKVHFNDDTDTLTIVLSDSPVHQTLEIEHGIVDLDGAGEILAVEIYGASDVITEGLRHADDPLEFR